MNLLKIRLAGDTKRCSALTEDPDIRVGNRLVVRTDDILALGTVVGIFPDIDPELVAGKLPTVIERRATDEDLAQEEKNHLLEKRALQFCQQCIEARQLPIHLVRVECLFDASKIIFFFTAPGRVDFRELVKDLVQEFRTRIELRQIGVRHRAKMVGGLGICGSELCCASFLKDFEPVSVRMAKEQQLSLNPSKISGVCGRLMCCLTFEHPIYQELRRHLPRLGKRVKISEGEGKIIRYNLIRQTVTLEMEEGQELEISLSLLPMGPPRGTAEEAGDD
jgi:cell fate regulator YaaT (PSP1 superfamily)|uniref:Stage 0 sporulation protein n=1 Tax=Desulfobacca acetoxidans TaxID=60893 RepID=A0A7V6A435_9BACT